eukprot:1648363-Pyramimonas_sp.AAC.1
MLVWGRAPLAQSGDLRGPWSVAEQRPRSGLAMTNAPAFPTSAADGAGCARSVAFSVSTAPPRTTRRLA